MKPLETIKQELKEAIVKANPSITTLGIGSIIYDTDQHWYGVVTIIDHLGIHARSLFGGNGMSHLVFVDQVRLIQRPIQLSDVLLAMSNTPEGCMCLIDPSGQICRWTWGKVELVGVWYDLTHPYDQQSEEVYRFLHSIIC